MASVLEAVPQAGRILVIRLRSLGDCVLTTPALALLKRARPDLRIAVVVEDRFRSIFEGNPDVELLLLPELGAVRRWRPLLSLNLHGGGRSAAISALSGAGFRAGFSHFGNSFVYNIKIPTAQQILHVNRKVHTAEHLASAVFHLGVPIGEIPRAKLSVAPAPALLPYAVIHPFASHPEKTWPAARFLAVAEHLKSSLDLEPVFIGADADDFAPFRAWRTLGGESLSAIKSLVAGAVLFVGNDSGPAHLAAAFGVPVVAIFGATDPAIWGPWRTPSEVLSGPSGIASVPIDSVLAALGRLRVHA